MVLCLKMKTYTYTLGLRSRIPDGSRTSGIHQLGTLPDVFRKIRPLSCVRNAISRGYARIVEKYECLGLPPAIRLLKTHLTCFKKRCLNGHIFGDSRVTPQEIAFRTQPCGRILLKISESVLNAGIPDQSGTQYIEPVQNNQNQDNQN